LDDFCPEIIHSHHPFLLGDTALRVAGSRGLPLVFTHHAMYEHFTHYVPLDSAVLKTYVVELATGYANFCDRVVAPSKSVAGILRGRGVSAPIEVIPTGVDVARFADGDGNGLRRRVGVPQEAFVIGYVGRLAQEKNLELLTRAVCEALKSLDRGRFLVVGSGESEDAMRRILTESGLSGRAHFAGTLTGRSLVDAYHAMDVFVFASRSETQGMVLAEAMAAGRPVVALDAPGARELVHDGRNGRLLPDEDTAAFAEAIRWLAALSPRARAAVIRRARRTARGLATDHCVAKMLRAYRKALTARRRAKGGEDDEWAGLLRRVRREWDIWANRLASAAQAVAAQGDARPDDGPE